MATEKIRCISGPAFMSANRTPSGPAFVEIEIERVVHTPKHSDMLVAEFWHEHSKICFAYFVHGRPYIQLHGGQMDLAKAKATGVALDLAYDWLMEQGRVVMQCDEHDCENCPKCGEDKEVQR